jgi:hypothetical protein
LQVRRQQRHGRKQHHAEHENENVAGEKVAVGEQSEIQERTLAGQPMHQVKIETEESQRRFDLDFDRGEPVLLLAAIEEQLQCANADGKE